MSYNTENKRIAKNTLLLYARMILLTAINLFAVRVTINVLGAEDYGIYNVVGSVVALFALVTGLLTASTQRYLSYALGKKDYEGYKKVFNMFLLTFLVLGLVIVIAGASLSQWLFDSVLQIPSERIGAAKWVYHTSLGVCVVNMVTIPFSATLIAHEQMNKYAYISIFDGLLKIVVVYLLLISTVNRLELYGTLVLAEVALILLLYIWVVESRFSYCRFSLVWDVRLFRELTAFIGWNLIGALSGVGNTQGQNIMLNYFFGPDINAAKAVGDKMYSIVSSLGTNFYLAVTPQLVKSYASDDHKRMLELAIASSKYSYMLILLCSFPLIMGIDEILRLWLGEEATLAYLSGFCVLSLIYTQIATLEAPISNMIRATGRLRAYQIICALFTLSYLPLCWLTLRNGFNPLTTMGLLCIVMAVTQVVRVIVAKYQVGLSVRQYFRIAGLPIILISGACLLVWYMAELFIMDSTFWTGVERIAIGLFSVILFIGIFGLNKSERHKFRTAIISKLSRHRL